MSGDWAFCGTTMATPCSNVEGSALAASCECLHLSGSRMACRFAKNKAGTADVVDHRHLVRAVNLMSQTAHMDIDQIGFGTKLLFWSLRKAATVWLLERCTGAKETAPARAGKLGPKLVGRSAR
jgi:hypothetical protein